ncbi:hypothetical protein GCM10025856_09500 [Methylophaga marina]|uniref:DUF2232 domain-containing protein n=1 Tax=Methylophaga marina TaxID=45495 RepID=A0ABP3CQG6_9GAMM|nr:DUF2232 domain-containing protein [Methylophaga marina]BDZ73231.1 hypothetical protein GCM10025856_09500 [Methylophaga marina]
MLFKAIASYAMQGRWKAAATTAVLSALAIIFPPLNYLSSGVISLTTLRMGPREGVRVILATLAVFALLAGFLVGQLWVAGLVLLTSWLPVYLVTLVLGYTRSFALSLLTASGLGILVVLLMHVFIPDTASWWQQMLRPFIDNLSQQPSWQLNAAQTEQVSIRLSGLMTGLVAAGVCLNAILGIIIGRAWQSQLYNPGAFGTEFKQLRLGKAPAVFTAVLMAMALTTFGRYVPWLMDCLPVMLVVFGIQGLAIVHAIVTIKQKSKAWLITIYVLLVIMLPQMVMILASLGVIDQWFNLRARSEKSGTGI